jgi:hypothetical protein
MTYTIYYGNVDKSPSGGDVDRHIIIKKLLDLFQGISGADR